MELPTNNSIPFLDILITKLDQQILTSVYRKPSASSRYIHYSSAHPWKDKLAAIKSLLSRAYDYCSPQFLQDELTLLTNTFLQNGYTPTISSINSYTTSPYSPTTLTPPLQTHTNPPEPSLHLFTLPLIAFTKLSERNSTLTPSSLPLPHLAIFFSKDGLLPLLLTNLVLFTLSPVSATFYTLEKPNAPQPYALLRRKQPASKLTALTNCPTIPPTTWESLPITN